jgi:hypothetical protein
MKPLFSEEEKAQAVRTFLIACYHKKAEINGYSEIAKYLNSNRVSILYPIQKSGTYKNGKYIGPHATYTEKDAQDYYEGLVSIVSDTTIETHSAEMIKDANNQLFHFIHMMQNADEVSIDNKVQMIAPYDWMNLFAGWDKVLINMKNDIKNRDNEITDILKSILQLLKQNRVFLETMQKDYERYLPKDDAP